MKLNKKIYRQFLSLIAPSGKRSYKSLYNLFKAAIATIIFVFVVNLFSIGKSSFGEWGDFFGGVLNPLLTFLTFMGLLITIVIQQTELRESRVELKRSADALLEQSESLKKQNFENTFFQMLSIHNQIIDSIDLVSEDGKVTRGRDCFTVFYSRLSKIYRENKSKAKGKHSEAAVVKLTYYLFWKNHQNELGHYFRYLYNLVRFVKESDFSDGPYLRVVRAQLSDQELLLLFYNCVSQNGGNFTALVEEFTILDNMPKIRLFNKAHEHMLKPSAFHAQPKSF
jgi:hypothetical protein